MGSPIFDRIPIKIHYIYNIIFSYSLECRAGCLDCNVNVLLATSLYLGNGLLCAWVDRLKGFARLALVPLVVDKELQWNRKKECQ